MNNKQQEHINWLTLRDAELRLTEQTSYWDDSVENDFVEAFTNLMEKVLPMKEGVARTFWVENLMKMHTLIRRHQKIKHDYGRCERAYEQLYSEYQRIRTVLTNKKEEF